MCPRQSLYKYIYTQTHVYMHFFLHLCISVYNAEWVSSETNKFRHHCHAVLSGTGQRSCNSKKKIVCQNIISLVPHCGWFVWVERGIMITVMVTPLKQGTQSKREGFWVKIFISYTFLLRKKKNLSSATQKKSNFYNLITSNKHIYIFQRINVVRGVKFIKLIIFFIYFFLSICCFLTHLYKYSP